MISPLRIAAPPPDTRRAPTQYCKCGDVTREGKPVCTTHIEGMPYVQGLMERMRQVEVEYARVQRVLKMSAVPKHSLVVDEILSLLMIKGALTVPRVARELNYSVDAMEIYTRAMSRRGLCRVEANKRGVLTVTPISTWTDERVS